MLAPLSLKSLRQIDQQGAILFWQYRAWVKKDAILIGPGYQGRLPLPEFFQELVRVVHGESHDPGWQGFTR
jgi:hypothetical protein